MLIDPLEQELGGPFTHLVARLIDGCQPQLGKGHEMDVVVADDGDVGRNDETGLLERAEHADGLVVIGAEDCRRWTAVAQEDTKAVMPPCSVYSPRIRRAVSSR